MRRTLPLLLAALLAPACASAPADGEGELRVAPVVERDDLVGCLWEEIGEVRTEDRTSVTVGDDDASMRRALGRSAAARGGNAIIDFKSVRMVRVAVAGAPTPPRGGFRQATGLAIRINGGSCPAASAGG